MTCSPNSTMLRISSRISSAWAVKSKEPDIIEKGDYVDVCLYRRVADQNETPVGNVIYSDHDDAVLLYLNEINDQISTQKASEILKISDRRARTILKSLVERNILIRIDNGPQTHYILSGKHGVTRMPSSSG